MMVQWARPSASRFLVPTRKRATSSIGFCVADRPTRVSGGAGEGLEALEAQRQVHAALAAGHGVDLVDDHGARRGQHGAPGGGAEQDVQRLRGGDDDVRRLAAHARALVLRGVAGAHEGADLDLRQAQGGELLADAGERGLEVAVDVVGERLQRGDVDHAGLIGQAVGGKPALDQRIDHGEEGGERLARTGRGGDEHVALRGDRRPRRRLRGRRGREGAAEPVLDRRMKVTGHGAIEAQRPPKEERGRKLPAACTVVRAALPCMKDCPGALRAPKMRHQRCTGGEFKVPTRKTFCRFCHANCAIEVDIRRRTCGRGAGRCLRSALRRLHLHEGPRAARADLSSRSACSVPLKRDAQRGLRAARQRAGAR